MSALLVMLDVLLAAAELVALLFIPPALASEPGAVPVNRSAPADSFASSLEVRLAGTAVNVRVNQHFRNRGLSQINLSANLPPADEYTQALNIHRRERSVNLLHVDGGCSTEPFDGASQGTGAGHARLQLDEMIADALQLNPGDTASIEVVARMPVQRVGKAFRFALPDGAAVPPQSHLIDQSDAQFLLIVPHPEARGSARLILRPFYLTGDAIDSARHESASEVIELGELNATLSAYVIPLANRAQLEALEPGAIELETLTGETSVHATLTLLVRTEPSPTLARLAP